MQETIPEYTVSEISFAIKRTMEDAFARVRVRGEIFGCKRADSGHYYLSLKDENANLSAVCWKGVAAGLKVKPEDGLEVVAAGRITTFAGKSSYQLVIEQMEVAGAGALLKLLEERKQKFAAEGLFDPAHKKPIPFLPRVIGVVTSPAGAVIRDIIHRVTDRFPVRIIVWPTLVQGEGAAEQIAAAVNGFNRLPADGPVPRPDLLIVARGGGSLEDLWCFNEEIVIRAVYDSEIPLISAVGHETDFSICDFVADMRAPTPSAAAELAVPDSEEVLAKLNKFRLYMRTAFKSAYESRNARLIAAVSSPYLANPLNTLVFPRLERSDRAADKILSLTNAYIEQKNAALCENAAKLDALSPLKVLARGYAAVLKDGRAVKSVEELNENDTIDITLADGKAVCRVTERERFN